MHITIRRYKTDSPKEVTRIVNERWFPLIKKIAGFVAYYGIETGEGGWRPLPPCWLSLDADGEGACRCGSCLSVGAGGRLV